MLHSHQQVWPQRDCSAWRHALNKRELLKSLAKKKGYIQREEIGWRLLFVLFVVLTDVLSAFDRSDTLKSAFEFPKAGWGADSNGGTIRELTRYAGIEKIDFVEIDKEVVDISIKYFPITASKLDDPRVHAYYEDGLKFVRQTEEKYDLIIVDSTDPFGPGEGLFTAEFYGNCHRALSDEGILINQHESPYYEAYANNMKRAHKRIKEVFEISRVYQAHIPTYPSGHWLFGFASKKFDPIKDLKAEEWNKLGLKTKYYNTDLHVGCFALPNYVKEMLDNVE